MCIIILSELFTQDFQSISALWLYVSGSRAGNRIYSTYFNTKRFNIRNEALTKPLNRREECTWGTRWWTPGSIVVKIEKRGSCCCFPKSHTYFWRKTPAAELSHVSKQKRTEWQFILCDTEMDCHTHGASFMLRPSLCKSVNTCEFPFSHQQDRINKIVLVKLRQYWI